MTTCPSCKEELPEVCPECGNPRDPQWIACVKAVPGLATQHTHICFECGAKQLELTPEDSQLAERIMHAMTTTNETASLPGLDMRTGVDHEWISDARIALTALLKQPEKMVQELDETARPGETHADTVVRVASQIADAMRAQRNSRGGIRNGNDPREMMAMFQENMPLILNFFEKLGALSEKRRG